MVKKLHIALVISMVLYLLETVFLAGLFTNVLVGGVALILAAITTIVSLVKKNYTLALIDFLIVFVILGYLTLLSYL